MPILTIIMPLLGVAVVAAVMGNFIQFGFLFDQAAGAGTQD